MKWISFKRASNPVSLLLIDLAISLWPNHWSQLFYGPSHPDHRSAKKIVDNALNTTKVDKVNTVELMEQTEYVQKVPNFNEDSHCVVSRIDLTFSFTDHVRERTSSMRVHYSLWTLSSSSLPILCPLPLHGLPKLLIGPTGRLFTPSLTFDLRSFLTNGSNLSLNTGLFIMLRIPFS